MSDYLGTLVARSTGHVGSLAARDDAGTIRPRLPSLFEPTARRRRSARSPRRFRLKRISERGPVGVSGRLAAARRSGPDGDLVHTSQLTSLLTIAGRQLRSRPRRQMADRGTVGPCRRRRRPQFPPRSRRRLSLRASRSRVSRRIVRARFRLVAIPRND
jgi:hypothetical protein